VVRLELVVGDRPVGAEPVEALAAEGVGGGAPRGESPGGGAPPERPRAGNERGVGAGLRGGWTRRGRAVGRDNECAIAAVVEVTSAESNSPNVCVGIEPQRRGQS